MALPVRRFRQPPTHEPVWVVAAPAVAALNTAAAPISPVAVTTARPLRSELMGSRGGIAESPPRSASTAGRCALPQRSGGGVTVPVSFPHAPGSDAEQRGRHRLTQWLW